MTKAFVAANTMDFLINKNAIPKAIRKKLGIWLATTHNTPRGAKASRLSRPFFLPFLSEFYWHEIFENMITPTLGSVGSYRVGSYRVGSTASRPSTSVLTLFWRPRLWKFMRFFTKDEMSCQDIRQIAPVQTAKNSSPTRIRLQSFPHTTAVLFAYDLQKDWN